MKADSWLTGDVAHVAHVAHAQGGRGGELSNLLDDVRAVYEKYVAFPSVHACVATVVWWRESRTWTTSESPTVSAVR